MSNAKKSALIVVDVQRDFCEGGALAASDTLSLLAPLQQTIEKARRAGSTIVFTQDWHPAAHSSFATPPRPRSRSWRTPERLVERNCALDGVRNPISGDFGRRVRNSSRLTSGAQRSPARNSCQDGQVSGCWR